MTIYINIELYILSQRSDNDEIYIIIYILNWVYYDIWRINDRCHLSRQ